MSRTIVTKIAALVSGFALLASALVAVQPAQAANQVGYAGNVDDGFDSLKAAGSIGTEPVMATLSDGSVVVGSKPHDWGNGIMTSPLMKFLPDGSIDSTFSANLGSIDTGVGINDGVVSAIVVTSNDEIVIGGDFRMVGGNQLDRIAVIQFDGKVPTSHPLNQRAAVGFNGAVTKMVIDAANNITVGGNFTSFNGVHALYLARMNIDGTVDQPFSDTAAATGAAAGVQPGYEITQMVLTPNGRVVLVWHLNATDPGNGNNYQLLRVGPDGSYDASFGGTHGTRGAPYGLGVANSGNPLDESTEYYLLGGDLRAYSGQSFPSNGLVKISFDGNIDPAYSGWWDLSSQAAGAAQDAVVIALQVQSNGRVILITRDVSNNFFLMRLNADGTLDQLWNPDNRAVKNPDSLQGLYLDPSGKFVYVAGYFQSLFGTSNAMVAKLFTASSFQVIIDPNDGVTVPYTALSTDADGSFTVPSGLARPGYTFDSFMDAPVGITLFPGDYYLPAYGGDIILVAQWSATRQNITYSAGGGLGVPPGSATASTGTSFTVQGSSLVRAGYTFAGWNDGISQYQPLDNYLMGPTDVVLTAAWQPNTLVVTYDSQGGSAVGNGAMVVGSFASAGLPPTRPGYTFGGWFTAPSGGTAISFPYAGPQTSNFTLYAHWTANNLSVTYDSQGGSAVSNGSMTVGGNIASAPVAPTKSGFTFGGWFTAPSGGTAISFPYSGPQTSDFTLYAQWTANPAPVTPTSTTPTTIVGTFNSQGGSAISPVVFAIGQPVIALPSPVREGYTFVGWFTHPVAGDPVTPGYVFGLGDVTLYARWNPNTNPIVFDSLGGPTIPDGTYLTGQPVGKLPAPTRDGYIFLGWVTADGAETSVDESYRPASLKGIKVKALWLDRHNQFQVRRLVAFTGTASVTSAKQLFKLDTFKSRLNGMSKIYTQVQIWVPKSVSDTDAQAYANARAKEVGKLVTSTLKIKSKIVIMPWVRSKGYQARHSWANVNVQFLK